MIDRFEAYIQSQKLIQWGDKILIGVSGGLDSIVLSHIFSQTSYSFAIAHCNFQLRGKESEADAVFVKNLAHQYQVSYFEKVFPTKTLAAKRQISIQMLARELRYQWFESLLAENGFDLMATAHHLNDTVETLWLNLIRGTGIAGLHGIPPQNGQIIRPLLFATREEIYQYALDNSLKWREDSSNQENYYRRNLLRNEVMPLLKQLNPNIEHTLAQSIEKFRAVEVIFRESMQILKEEIMQEKNEMIYLDYQALAQKTEPIARIFYLLEAYGFNYRQCKDIWESIQGISGKVFRSAHYELVKDRAFLILSPITPQDLSDYLIFEGDNQISLRDYDLNIDYQIFTPEFIIPKDPWQACLDADRLQFPLKIRRWQEGDFFYPLGMDGRQKISDFLINQKISLALKSQVKVLCSGEDIMWVVGHRIDNRFKITAKTQTFIWIKKELKEHNM
ncbi:MAG: tRNA lysidine(34) synthetase TilS [Microscillaceae bacterium]|nr:tRNA lysidine(34) synthetase TilS [Microscillaceae bacterium]